VQYCASMRFCNHRSYVRIKSYTNKIQRNWFFCTYQAVVCMLNAGQHATWIMKSVEWFMTCLLFHIRDWCHWTFVHWLVCCVGGRVACKTFPSNSFGCLFGIVLVPLKFILWFYTHVCYLIYVMHKLMLDYWFVYEYIVHVLCA